jgi:hypothetical protein
VDDDHNHIALRDYVERLMAHESALNIERFAAMEKAMTKASEAMNIRPEGMNEFRRQIEAQEQRYGERSQLQALAEKVEFRLSKLERAESMMVGKSTMIWAVIVVGVAVLGAAVSFFK